MVEFETIKAEEIKFGRNNFIEVARKKAKTDEGENEFVSLSRGFYAGENADQKRFRKSISLPLDKEVVNQVAEKIKEMVE